MCINFHENPQLIHTRSEVFFSRRVGMVGMDAVDGMDGMCGMDGMDGVHDMCEMVGTYRIE